ncbi:MAG: histidine kinase, partial [Verrucomicrobiaceae bacterium]
MRHRWGSLFRDMGRQSSVVSSMRSDVEREPPTLADSHLVMNSLNQLAAHFHARTGEEDPRLFAVADYLRFVFRGGVEPHLPLDEEFALLQSYVQLVGRNRGVDIPLEFYPGSEADTTKPLLVQRHLSCDLLAALMRALPGDVARAAQLNLRFEGASADWAYSLRALMVTRKERDIERRLRAEVDSLAERFGW